MLSDHPAVPVLAVTDLDRARQFYEGTLGLSTQGDAAEGVMYRAGGVDLLVSDVLMPRQTGPEMVAALAERWPGMAVLFVTGYAETAALSHGHLPEGMQVMTKPFELSALGQRVQALVRAARD